MRLGIDASNLRRGGGITHLVEILRAADPAAHGIGRVTVWGPRSTLERVEPRKWLDLSGSELLEGALPQRLYWQKRILTLSAAEHADLLFAPGGLHTGGFRPFVTMSRNLLPFDPEAAAGYGRSWMRLKMALLRRAQSATFRAADGVIFLNRTAQRTVEAVTGELTAETTIIPHGVSARFGKQPAPQAPLAAYGTDRPFRWLYVSIIDVYKHQDRIVRAAAMLRQQGMPIRLDLVGPAYLPALKRLRRILEEVDPSGKFIRYHGSVDYGELERVYAEADAFVFASSCENMPNILVEAMAAGLPIACSSRGVMPEVLAGCGLLFDPLDEGSAIEAMGRLTADAELRRRLAEAAHRHAATYTWERCAHETLDFLAHVGRSRAARPL